MNDRIIELYKSGTSIKKLSIEFHRSSKTISKIIKDAGLSITSSQSKKNEGLILSLIQQGKLVSEISRITGSSYYTIASVAESHNLSVNKSKYSKNHTNESEVLRLYSSGLTSRNVAEKLGISPTSVKSIIKNHGYSRPQKQYNGRHAKYPHITKELLAKEYTENGKSQYQIAEELGVPQVVISRFCKDYGIETREASFYGVGRSKAEIELCEFISSKVDVVNNHKDGDYEIDVFVPSLNIGLEFNGSYYHSSLFKDKYYHQNKSEYFRQKGIRIVHIYDSHWIHDRNKVECLLDSILGIYTEKLYARKCDVTEIESDMARAFIGQYHMQGPGNPSYSMGLYHQNVLVGVMSFRRSSVDYDYEIDRLVYKAGIMVIGGTQKLFTHFIRRKNPNTVMTYSDNDLFDGGVYRSLGFKLACLTGPRYYYVDPNTLVRYSRQKFQKHKLVRQGHDPSKTEFEIMEELGYLRIHDSGNRKWVWTNSNH